MKTVFPVKEYHCVWLTCNRFMQNVAGMIHSLIESPEAKYSLKANFPKIFKDRTLVERVTQSYKIKSPFAEAQIQINPKQRRSKIAEDLRAAAPEDLTAFLILKDLLVRATKEHPRKAGIIVFLDEFDQVHERAQVGALLKALNEVQFIVIGVGSSRESLLGHHGSIGRKLSFSAFEVPLFGLLEVDHFYDGVENRSRGALRFAKSFRKLVHKKSSGYPWLMQQLGFYSVLNALSTPKGLNHPTSVEVKHYKGMIHGLLQSQLGDSEFDVLSLAGAQKQVLETLSGTARGRASEAFLLDKMPAELRSYYDQGIESLREAGLVYEQGQEVRVNDPLTKILIDLAREENHPRHQLIRAPIAQSNGLSVEWRTIKAH